MTAGEPGEDGDGPPVELARLQEPVQQYLGLTLAEAEALAASESRILRRGIEGRRDLVSYRVRVELDADGRVCRVRAG